MHKPKNAVLSRREFLLSSGCACLFGCATARSRPVSIIDTHTHFYDPTRPQGVPWPPKEDKVLYRTVLPAELEKIARPLGVQGTIVVEASPLVADNDWILNLAASNPFILGLVGHLRPGEPNFAKDLNRLKRNKLFRGIRVGGWDLKVAPENPVYFHDLNLLADNGLSLDVLTGTDSLPKLNQIAERIPHLRIVINHCAGVKIEGKAPAADWTAAIEQVASHSNVYMKASGLPEATGREFSAPRDVEFYRPTLDVLWNAFGENRLIYGSNWPVSTRFADYPTVLQIVQSYFNSKGIAAAAKYFRGNAVRVYRPSVII